jgi:DNA modification methylase
MNRIEVSDQLQLVREQLKLPYIKRATKNCSSESGDWDYATADTKTETHCFHTYPAMMIPQVARRLIAMFGRCGMTVLDPFCGSGTTLVEARMANLNAWGIDINPLASLIARAKTTLLDTTCLQHHALCLLDGFEQDCQRIRKDPEFAPIPNFFNLDYWFKPSVSRQLSALHKRVLAIQDPAICEFFRVPFSETVREVSYTRNSEFKLFRMPEDKLEQHNPDVGAMFFSKIARNLRGMAQLTQQAKGSTWIEILQEDTRHRTSVPSNSIDLVVTSPPYGDSRTTVAYGQFSRLSLQWLGLSWEDIRNIDSRLLGGRRIVTLEDAAQTSTLRKILNQVAKADEKRALDVANFYHDFTQCLNELCRVCKLDAKACFVVGNRTVKRIPIPTDRILIEIAERCGFEYVDRFYRNIPNKRMPRKNSPSNVPGDLGRTITQEHIVVLKKIGNGLKDDAN